MRESAPPPRRLSRILVVEDEAALRGLLEVSIRDIGAREVLACGSCAEALDKAPVFAPDLVVVDLQLVDGDGMTLIAALRATPELARTGAVVLTARPDLATNRAAQTPGVIGVLPKPFDPMSLTETLDALWRDAREDHNDG
ncbi:response regulator [Roseospira navarrensis]|uniref:response regulator n=1 Tax=Roseospira navarrensis TaxID=140058 RepID=UPI001478C2E2|nr:response regulator [Roseospira navarrensis]